MDATKAEADGTQAERASSSPGIRLNRYSFGSTSAIVTGVGLIVGIGADASRAVIVSGLLIIALADNVSDSLSIHIYQESEHLEGRASFRATLTNFATRVVVAFTFVALVLALPARMLALASVAWGMALLAGLSFALARSRRVRVLPEVMKHLLIAAVVIAVSKGIGALILDHVR